ncbi:UvrD-helicase domain-containing protein [Yersinia enterocolitica]|uniref:UvrD-helicase domain-containing protein n=2 Tax=Enterobacterales TaxID=91347 RepID=UPI0029B1F4A3|nr:UvrD-helicase domain-containing protein [Yersinia enterocolitica]
MSVDAVLNTSKGLIVAPAGCGKTHLIIEALGFAQSKPYLVLTHTTAGVTALKKRLSRFAIPPRNYVVTTIDGWALKIAGCFPGLCPLDVGPENPTVFYPSLRRAVRNLVVNGNISEIITATYSRLLVDEYQDCNSEQHELTCALSRLLPTIVFGDPMQCIFSFSGPMPDWNRTVETFFPTLATLQTPWRWNNAQTPDLGQWILEQRHRLLRRERIDLRSCPDYVRFHPLSRNHNDNIQRQQREYYSLLRQFPDDSVLVMGDSRRASSRHQFAQRINGLDVVEPVDLSDVMRMATSLDEANAANVMPNLLQAAAELMTNVGISATLRRIASIQAGRNRTLPSSLENALVELALVPTRHNMRTTLLLLEEKDETRVFRAGALQVLKDAINLSISSPEKSIRKSASVIREQRRYQGEGRVSHRSIGSTLLLKGLECDHALILNVGNMGASDLYVALSRGAKSVTVFSDLDEFTP